jgi:hypothetical protein
MNVPNPVRVSIVALSLMCIPALAQNPAPTTTPAPTPPVTATPAATVTATPDATVTAAPVATPPADTSASPEQMKAQMAKMQTTMNENMAKRDAADIARTANLDAEQAAMKSDVEMKHAMFAQMQTMSDQIQQLDARITALSKQLEAATTKPVKSHKAKPAPAQ